MSGVLLFIDNHKLLCGLTLGLAILVYCIVYWLGRAVTWITELFGTAEKVKRVYTQAELGELFKEEVVKGAKSLLEKGIKGACNLAVFNYLVTQLFLLKIQPQFEIEFHVRVSDEHAVSFTLSESIAKKVCGRYAIP